MNKILFDIRCKCDENPNEEEKPRYQRKIRPFTYPVFDNIKSKTFRIKHEGQFSLLAKLIINSFQNKYIYYAIDDILYNSKLESFEYKTLLAILYTPMISLQNNYFANFFDIWIGEVYLEEIIKPNKFLTETCSQISYITIKFIYKVKIPFEKKKLFW